MYDHFWLQERYEEAKAKLENAKKDFIKLWLLPKEVQQTTSNKKLQVNLNIIEEKKENKIAKEIKAKKELNKIFKQRKLKISYKAPIEKIKEEKTRMQSKK